jgi:uncharacterized membrane protein YfcA
VLLLVLIGVVGLVAGILIGAVSVGGVIVLPALVGFAGLTLHEAIQLTFAGFLAAGLAALATAPQRTLRDDWPLLAATIPGAVFGTVLVHAVPAAVVLPFVVAAALGSLATGLLPSSRSETDHLAVGVAVGLGTLTGFGSALSGTGGPLLMTPLLLMLRIDVHRAIRLAQIAQLPIALAATITHLSYAPLDPLRTAVIASAMVVGMMLGVALQGRVPALWLKRATMLAVLLATAAMVAPFVR